MSPGIITFFLQHSQNDGLSTQSRVEDKNKCDMDLALDELLSDFHSYQPPIQKHRVSEGLKFSLLPKSISPPPPPKSPFNNEEQEIILPPPPDFQDEDPCPSILLQALTPKPPPSRQKSTTDLLIHEINELSELLPWKGDTPNFIDNKVLLVPSNPSSPLGTRPTSNFRGSKPQNPRICIISKRDETPESDSGIESIESLSPKEFDFSPACSPAGAKSSGPSSLPPSSGNPSYFPPLLSEANHSGTILSSLLHPTSSLSNHSTSELLYSNNPNMSEPQHPNNATNPTTFPSFLQSNDDIFDSLKNSNEGSWRSETEETPKYDLLSELSSWEPKELKCDYEQSSLDTNTSGLTSNSRRIINSKDFYCEKCKMSLGTKTKYERHMRSHIRSKEFKCETCGKEFMIKKNLALHYKLHSEQQKQVSAYNCSLCLKSYQSKPGLASHMKLIHGPKEDEYFGAKKVEEEDAPKKALQFCRKCNKSFKTKKSFQKHSESCSTVQEPQEADWISSANTPTSTTSDDLLQTIHSMELDQLLF
eukprot:TRINITY_DN4083_c0_g1_i1.p1 TRINITY_DN4083_c0_g1~~TRINITY_DN4083_c0_g1_i1.p1  ORF type:complete len:533 (-),score=108.47 TRINITY_DN4083_c0_g1_i1:213-1811(-)